MSEVFCAGCGDPFDDEDICERCNRCDGCCWHDDDPEEDD